MVTLERAELVLMADCVVTSVSESGLDLHRRGIDVANSVRGGKETRRLPQASTFVLHRLKITVAPRALPLAR